MAKPMKKGSVSKTEKGEILLVNEQNKAFKVMKVAALVWNRCDGQTTIDDLTKEFSQKTNQEEGAVKHAIETIVNQMEKAGLMESK
jgi:phosphohistidine swiveling domain-containing protein